MAKNIFLGNLPSSATESELHQLFEAHGEVHSVNVIEDLDTGRPPGFAFIEMDPEAADNAINALAGTELGGRSLNVSGARPRPTSSGPRRQHDSYDY